MSSKLTARLLASTLVLGCLLAPAMAQEATPEVATEAAQPAPVSPDTVVATVAGAKITEGDITAASEDMASQFAQVPPAQRRAAIISALIDVKALSQLADKEKLQDDPALARKIEFARERALHNAYFEKYGVEAMTEEALQARYEEERERYQPQEELSARHILVDTREVAEKIIERLEAGEKFEDLARELSKDTSSQNGGDLGFFGRGQMVPPFEEAVFALEPGEYTKEPVETQFGWHVIESVEKRQTEFPAFEQVRDQVRQIVLRESYVDMLEKAREDVAVEFTDPALEKQIQDMEAQVSGQQAPAPAPAPAQ
ncbi:peptidylprolyl isomerase [Aureimonas fodinaquatilis]|uniref:Parvulin-like PPIase n=1 Tax=Aureimonas fodinaquatilis TaxID=2565783 RepID=A0A5B0DYN1_9HYPH|nr:peptidylprolyl isomerase [Aureimonas fodinaquatilis]KAA0971613.1 peptidylprolyl isomerase [Aureimonas fodinaquatilis]